MSSQIGTHVFVFNPCDNGGESLCLNTRFFDDGSGEVLVDQNLRLCSYRNSAQFNLSGTPLLPDQLRVLADELESALAQKGTELEAARIAQGLEER